MHPVPTVDDEPIAATSPRNGVKRGPSRTVLNFFLDLAILIVFVALVVLTLTLRLVFPSPSSSAGWKLWGRSLDQWHGVTFALIMLLALGVLLHLMMHWNWVCGVLASRWFRNSPSLRSDDGAKTLLGVGLLAILFLAVGAVAAVAMLTVQPPK